MTLTRGMTTAHVADSAADIATGATAHSTTIPRWYQSGVIYEAHVRAFRDSNHDGVGDFRGLVQKLDYLCDLGITAIWLLPFYQSPLRDDGYDISDYRQIHPSYGSLRDFKYFLREAHRRDLRVITELVLAHTSDQHPWFRRARQAKAGTSYRNFYVWSDTPDRFKDARIIFKDFETSNWTYDQAVGSYYWHRFYAHQPALNYDNPAVRKAMLDVMEFWLDMGVDGLRLDAVPYLYAREGTSCENLPETLNFLNELRKQIDNKYTDRMLLAEANQWPEDAVAYMEGGDRCHMAFHFPLMPRMFMAARQEDRYPIVDILAETPAAPTGCQWALFLRNHDELTLEMVTDEERDYMYRTYAQDPQSRINMGIRRRLAPLLENDRSVIEMMNGLLFSLPGTPIVYYGDEIGMGDNIYLGDRDAVRTPMQWDGDRNAGFSEANPQQLYLPVVTDPSYHAQAVNVEAQNENASSLLWWMRRLIHLRRRYPVFAIGALELLRPDNRKVLAFIRRLGGEQVLVVVNLSRFAQCVELDLSEFRGAVPMELFGNTQFPTIGELPYFITLGPHGFYWFALVRHAEERSTPKVTVGTGDVASSLFEKPAVHQLEKALATFIPSRRWFLSKGRTITAVLIEDVIPITKSNGDSAGIPSSFLVIARVELDFGTPLRYLVPLAVAWGEQSETLRRWQPEAIIADLVNGRYEGVLIDAIWIPEFAKSLLKAIGRRGTFVGMQGVVVGDPSPKYRLLTRGTDAELTAVPMTAEQSNTSILLGDEVILKLLRRVEDGINPGVEVGRALGERLDFKHSPRVAGSLAYRSKHNGRVAVVASLEEYIPNEGDGWSYVVDSLDRELEEVLAHTRDDELRLAPPSDLLGGEQVEIPPGHLLLGPHLNWACLLGQRTGELHMALSCRSEDASFNSEPLSSVDRQALYHGGWSMVRRVMRQLTRRADVLSSDMVSVVIERQAEIGDRMRRIMDVRDSGRRIRCHGDYHLGQVLWTGKDVVVIDFEGEPVRSLGERRLKRSPVYDLAGMIRSFHYASRAAAMRLSRDLRPSLDSVSLERWLSLWYRWVSATFVKGYRDATEGLGLLPRDSESLLTLFDFYLLEKAVYELGYEANSRPEWIDIPAKGVLEILDVGP